MFAQPLRWGGLALAYTLATATLVLVTVVASNLVLSAVAGLGSLSSAEPMTADRGAVEAVLLSADQRAEQRAEQRAGQRAEQRSGNAECKGRREHRAERGEHRHRDGRCVGRRAEAADPRP